MPLFKLSAAEKRKVSVFSTCLLLAAAAWLLTGLSSNYNFKAKGVLTFKNTPQIRAFHSLQSDTVDITLQGTGWQMVFNKLKSTNLFIPVDLHTLDHQNYVVLNNQLLTINNSREAGHRIIAIVPDTLYFDFTRRISKKIPVQLLSNISYQHQFAPSDEMVVKPAEITVNGPGNLIANITSWKTDSLKLFNVNGSIDMRVNLQPVHQGNLSIYPKTVQVHIPVDEFTEKTLDIPVKLVNNPKYYKVKLFPQKVKVTFITSLSRYKETDEDFFEASADLNLWEQQKFSVLPVNLTHIPAFCKIVRIEPRNVDFIIKK